MMKEGKTFVVIEQKYGMKFLVPQYICKKENVIFRSWSALIMSGGTWRYMQWGCQGKSEKTENLPQWGAGDLEWFGTQMLKKK